VQDNLASNRAFECNWIKKGAFPASLQACICDTSALYLPCAAQVQLYIDKQHKALVAGAAATAQPAASPQGTMAPRTRNSGSSNNRRLSSNADWHTSLLSNTSRTMLRRLAQDDTAPDTDGRPMCKFAFMKENGDTSWLQVAKAMVTGCLKYSCCVPLETELLTLCAKTSLCIPHYR
jgi:hypothetical protein